MSPPIASVLSGRAQDRLAQLQRALSNELRALTAKQSLLYGALQACDMQTQGMVLQEYLDHVDAVLAAGMRLRAFVARHSVTQDSLAQAGAVTGESELGIALE